MRRALSALAVLFALLPASLCGCSAGTLENTAVIKAVTLDVSSSGYTMTACVLNPEGEKPYITINASGESMTELVSRLAATTERKPFFGQCEVIIFSEAAAKGDMRPALNWFMSSAGAEWGTLICVMKGRAADAFLYTEGLFKDPAVDVSRTLKNAAENGPFPLVSLADAKLSLESISACCLMPVCEVTEEPMSFMVSGTAVAREGALCGSLTEREALGAKCMLSRASGASFFTEGRGFSIVSQSSRLSSAGLNFSCDARMSLTVTEGEAEEGAEELAESYIAECISECFRAAKTEGDFLGLAAYSLNRDSALMRAYSKYWQDALSAATLDISVKARKTGGGYYEKGVFTHG